MACEWTHALYTAENQDFMKDHFLLCCKHNKPVLGLCFSVVILVHLICLFLDQKCQRHSVFLPFLGLQLALSTFYFSQDIHLICMMQCVCLVFLVYSFDNFIPEIFLEIKSLCKINRCVMSILI